MAVTPPKQYTSDQVRELLANLYLQKECIKLLTITETVGYEKEPRKIITIETLPNVDLWNEK